MSIFRENWLREAFEKGARAQQAGAPLSDNPYHRSDMRRQFWSEGYLTAERLTDRKAPNAPLPVTLALTRSKFKGANNDNHLLR